MGLFRTQLRYDMFDFARSADEAKRFVKCANIYHRGQELAWDGRDILGELIAKHGGVHLDDPAKRQALARVFNIILWGELAAWKISAQLADRLVPMEAKLAATAQAFDEARHFYVMHDYLDALGFRPTRMDRAPQALLDVVLETDDLAVKILGMQLMVETMALTLFQTVRDLEVEPVLTELLRYFERDEARHVGLGMQFLPTLIKDMSKRQLLGLITQQTRLLGWAMAEQWVLRRDFEALGLNPRVVMERARRKQVAAISSAYAALGIDFNELRNPASMSLNAAVELLFPYAPTGPVGRVRNAVAALWRTEPMPDASELGQHGAHPIRTARGKVAGADAEA
ncbi:MAG: ferritin-like domain-containing protein [Kofleriaceae bacterium]|jgi:hypothetical protein|nr:ferritin-like domain-containing protein [Kofleriaceae bacterium]MBP6838848.1 ferritin-like domain-containing protein [Kofleriaceae bacterium]MBP9202782.1 ferritin-like domain-containing protein [Kofleriaceae bacterium]